VVEVSAAASLSRVADCADPDRERPRPPRRRRRRLGAV